MVDREVFPYETKASISFIPIRSMSLWCPIMKRKEIIICISVYPNWQTNINSKNDRKISFSYETKASISFILMRRMCLWCPIMKRKEIIMWICVCPSRQTNFVSKKWVEVKLFLWNQSNNVIYHNEKNKVMVPNHKKKRDYYVNPCLSQLIEKIWF